MRIRAALLILSLLGLPVCAQPEGYRVPDAHVWDNWVVESEGVLHRYALSAPRTLSADARHENAVLRHAESRDGGKTWVDRGVILRPGVTPGLWADHVIWSGNTTVRDLPGGGKEFLLFFTGRTREGGELQKIGLARSRNGHDYEVLPEPVLEPTRARGYDLGRGDGVIMAWRDPYVFYNEEAGRWEMLFAAKAKQGGETKAVIARAVAEGDSLTRWKVADPLELPRSYLQMELPIVIRKNGEYFLFTNTKSRDGPSREGGAAVRGYRAPSLEGPWKPVYGNSDLIGDHRIYGLTVFERGGRGSGRFGAVGFYPRHVEGFHEGTGVIDLAWKDGAPRFELAPHLRPERDMPARDRLATWRRADGTVEWRRFGRETAAREALGLGHFGLALFLKELAVVARTGDRARIEEFFDGLLTTDFYKEYGLFMLGARAGEVAYARTLERYLKPRFVNGILKSNLVLATGLALPAMVRGEFSGEAFAISLGSLGLSSTAVHAASRGIKWLVDLRKARAAGTAARTGLAVGRLARAGAWFYTAAELAVILYVAEDLEHAVNGWRERRAAEESLADAGEAFFAAARAPDASAESLRAAAEDYDLAWTRYRDFLYRPLLEEEARFAGRLEELAREAKLLGDKQAATLRLAERQAVRENIERRYGSLERYAEHLRAEGDADLQERVDDLTRSYEKARSDYLSTVYDAGKRPAGRDYLGEVDDLDWLLAGGEADGPGDPYAETSLPLLARLGRNRARAGLRDALAAPSSNRLQAYDDELDALRAVRESLARRGRADLAAALDQPLARVRATREADDRLAHGSGTVRLDPMDRAGLGDRLDGALDRSR